MKLLAMRAKSGELLINIENTSVEALGKLLELKNNLDSLVKQIADNKYYTEEDRNDVEAVYETIRNNLGKVLGEYEKGADKASKDEITDI